VVLVARRRERLERLADEIRAEGGIAQIITADLTSEADRARLCDQTGPTDVLVNNAGLGWYGYGDEMTGRPPWKYCKSTLKQWCS